MKFKSIAFALLVIPLVATGVQGQNLFRTGRPDYTRDYPATYHDRYQANAPNAYRPNRSNDLGYDQERLNQAWENYRAEANRYQTRYGSNYGPGYGTTTAAAYDSVRPVGYESDYAPNRRCSLKPDSLRDRLPATTTPSGYYNNPSYYDNGFGSRNSSAGYGNGSSYGTSQYGDPYGTNLSRTASSRPLASLFKSLFGTSR